jgi:GDP-4-dehydro-6-deoxy-D-mannose reductase
MKFLITGITGFIGKELRKAIKSKYKDAEIYGLVRWSHHKEDTEGFIPIYGDLSNYSDMVAIAKEVKPDYIINLGAMTPVSLSFEKPFDYMEANFIGVMNLVEANRKFNPQLVKFIQASTPESYGIQEQPLTPESRQEPSSPYGISKAAADMYLLYAQRALGFPAVISRHTNCYGRKDQNHFVVEAIVTQMLKTPIGGKIYLGARDPKRDFLYIDDVVSFYMALIDKGVPGNAYTAGWNTSFSIEDLVYVAEVTTGWTGEIVWDSIPKRPGEVPEIRLDPSKAEKELGWKPQIGLHEGLARVMEVWRDK